MKLANGFGSMLLIAGALVTAVRIVVVLSGTTSSVWTSGGWELAMVVLIVVALIYVLATGFANRAAVPPETQPGFQDPAVVRYLLNDLGSALLWAMVRFYVGFVWFEAGYAKLIGKEGDWMTNGTALHGFWTVVPALNHKGANPRAGL